MWQENNTLAEHMRRTNRNLIVANSILLAIVLVMFAGGFRLLFNELAGPIEIDAKTLVSKTDPHKEFRYYYKVKGAQVTMDPIFQQDWVTYDRDGQVKSSTVEMLYYLMFVPSADKGYRSLVVASREPLTKTEYVTGALVPIPAKVKPHLEQSVPAGMMQSIMLPTMLDTSRFSGGSYWVIAILLPAFLIAVWNFLKVKRRSENLEEHPIAKQLKQYGNPRDIAVAIENEIRSAPLFRSSNVIITPNWVLVNGMWSTTVAKLEDLIWFYRKETQHSVNFIPTGKSQSSVFCFVGTHAEIAGSSLDTTNDLLTVVAQHAPWAYAGYSDEVHRLWKSSKDLMIRNVRQAQMEIAEKGNASQVD